MLISYNWLQKYFEEKLPEAEKIADGIIFHSFEIESIEKVKDDTIFDIKILPDRAHDCLCHWGIAKEVSAIFGIKIKNEKSDHSDNLSTSSLEIQINNSNCRRYIGQVVKGVTVGPSPDWLKEKLEAIGQRSINNIVDATNYVMFDLGNPIHAFDLNKLKSGKIIIDNAIGGEKITLLDGKIAELDESILTIRDEDGALAIAGVKGGKKAEIDVNTKNIVIEVANFEPVSTRKSAKKLGIYTDSAKRFENEIPAKLAEIAMKNITDLIIEVAKGERLDMVNIDNSKEEERKIIFDIFYINKLLGLNLEQNDISEILSKLNFSFKYENDKYEVTIPFTRLDILDRENMAEEIGRIYGYEKIVSELPKINLPAQTGFEIKDDEVWDKINQVKSKLINDGYKEVMTYAFTNKGEVEVLASASDKNFLRTNLSDGMKKSFELNKINLPLLEMEEIKLFEIGKVFSKKGETLNICLADKKEIKEMSLEEYLRDDSSSNSFLEVLGRGEGEPVPDHLKKNSLSESSISYFKMWSLYPFIVRDIAVWVPEGTKPEKLINIYNEFGTELLIREPKLFDSFTKEKRTSFAYRLVFQAIDRTLTDEEINKIMLEITEKIISSGWEVR